MECVMAVHMQAESWSSPGRRSCWSWRGGWPDQARGGSWWWGTIQSARSCRHAPCNVRAHDQAAARCGSLCSVWRPHTGIKSSCRLYTLERRPDVLNISCLAHIMGLPLLVKAAASSDEQAQAAG